MHSITYFTLTRADTTRRMKLLRLASLGLVILSFSGPLANAIGGGADGGGGDYLQLLRYAKVLTPNDPVALGRLPERNEEYYRYSLARAARTGLRKVRYLLQQGRRFHKSDGTPVTYTEEMLRLYEKRVNELEDSHLDKFKLKRGLKDAAGNRLTAKNYPDGRVEFDPGRWEEIESGRTFELALTLQEGVGTHEFLSMEGIETTGEYPVVATFLTEKFPHLPAKRPCKTWLIAPYVFFPQWMKTKSGVVFEQTCTPDGQPIKKFILNEMYFEPAKAFGKNTAKVNDAKEEEEDTYRRTFPLNPSTDTVQAIFTQNIDMPPQIKCVLNALFNSTHVSARLDREDRYLDDRGHTVREYEYSIPDFDDSALVYQDAKVQEALVEAHLAETLEARREAFIKGDRALGEAILQLDDLLRRKKTPALFIKYFERQHVKDVRNYPAKRAFYLREHARWQKREDRRREKAAKNPPKPQARRTILGEMIFPSGMFGYDYEPSAPYEPGSDAFAGLKACGYFNP